MLDVPTGLTSLEARRPLPQGGPNAIVDVAQHPLRRAMEKLWAPVPWMLEAAILLELVLGNVAQAGVVALLLAFNAGLGFVQESRARETLDALKSRLALVASARRDGAWANVSAVDLVPGDVYVARERRRIWSSRPSEWLVASSVADVAVVVTFAFLGILMAPLPAAVIIGLLAAAVAFAFVLDIVKAALFGRLAIA